LPAASTAVTLAQEEVDALGCRTNAWAGAACTVVVTISEVLLALLLSALLVTVAWSSKTLPRVVRDPTRTWSRKTWAAPAVRPPLVQVIV
jgi:hypothetical protein